MEQSGLFHQDARENRSVELLEGLLTPPYRLRGGKVDGVAGMDGKGAGLDRDPVQRLGVLTGAAPGGSAELLWGCGAGEPHPTGLQPDSQLGAPEDGGGGGVR